MEKSFTELLDGYEKGTLSSQEMERFFVLLNNKENESLLARSIDNKLNAKNAIEPVSTISEAEEQTPGKVANIQRPLAYRLIWAAACAGIIWGAVSYFQQKYQKSHSVTLPIAKAENDALPGKNGALLRLADGTAFNLDSAASGLISRQNGADVFLSNGQLNYKRLPAATDTATPTYNTVATPTGRQFQLTLPDATKVWLNAGSSITFPTRFTGRQRQVQISGEVYLEVAPDKNKPFMVTIRDSYTVEVLGTHFNINAYANEQAVRTTLLEGKIKVSPAVPEQTPVILFPGQEVSENQTEKKSPLRILKNVNTEKAVAWKNGFFDFEEVSIRELMRQVERWYDIEVRYENGVPDLRFFGKMSRNVTLQGLLKGLKGAGVTFRLTEKQLLITNQ